MTISERIHGLSLAGVDIETITMVLRSEGVPDSDIEAGYQDVSRYTNTEIRRGQFYIVPIT